MHVNFGGEDYQSTTLAKYFGTKLLRKGIGGGCGVIWGTVNCPAEGPHRKFAQYEGLNGWRDKTIPKGAHRGRPDRGPCDDPR